MFAAMMAALVPGEHGTGGPPQGLLFEPNTASKNVVLDTVGARSGDPGPADTADANRHITPAVEKRRARRDSLMVVASLAKESVGITDNSRTEGNWSGENRRVGLLLACLLA